MRIVITGGTGFLGRNLSNYLLESGHELILIRRKDLTEGIDRISKLINSSDVLINLAGSPVIKRWSASNRRTILESRVGTTGLLVGSISRLPESQRPKIFLSASAIGIYDSVNIHTEQSVKFGEDFLAEVCKQWESSLNPLAEYNIRVCVLRIGLVLGADGGMLKKLIPLFKAGLGGKIGSGLQSFSFIHIRDFCRIVEFLIGNNQCTGLFNVSAPEISTNALFTRTLARVLNRPAFFAVPAIALRMVYGQAASMLLSGQSVIPRHLMEAGFTFRYPDIDSAIRDILAKE